MGLFWPVPKFKQDNVYKIGETTSEALPFDTWMFYQADEADEIAQKTLSMSERTCFLHAAMRDSYPSDVQVELNGQALGLEG